MKSRNILLAIFIIASLVIPVVSASGFEDAVSLSITNGIIRSFIAISDSIYSITLGFDTTAGTGAVGAIYNIATYTPNPMDFGITKDYIDFSKSIYKEVFSLIIILTAISLLFIHFKPGAFQKLKEISGINAESRAGVLLEKGVKAIIISIFLYVFIYFILDINERLTKVVILDIIDLISPTGDNVILYFAMALCYLAMLLFFLWRLLEIFLFCGFAYLIALMFLSDHTKEKAEDLCMRFIQTVFFQFFIVLYYSACIRIIKTLTDSVYSVDVVGIADKLEMAFYIVMMLGGVYISYKMMFGTKVIKWVGRKAAVLV